MILFEYYCMLDNKQCEAFKGLKLYVGKFMVPDRCALFILCFMLMSNKMGMATCVKLFVLLGISRKQYLMILSHCSSLNSSRR